MKFLTICCYAMLFATAVIADENRRTPRDFFIAYFEAMEARQVDAGKAMKTPDCTDTLHMNIHNLNIVARLQPFYELSTSEQALVVVKPFRTSPGRAHEDVVYAELVKMDGGWRICNLARTDAKSASWLMKGFQMHTDAKLDLSPQALVGEWYYPCASTVVIKADGTGSDFPVGPAAPDPDQKPEPFTWTMDGTTFIRTFADRKDERSVTSIDHRAVSFKSVSKIYDAHWGRKNPEENNASKTPEEQQTPRG